jgi:hypothetical protein
MKRYYLIAGAFKIHEPKQSLLNHTCEKDRLGVSFL